MKAVNRRCFLRAGGAAAVLGTAGCDAPHKTFWPYTAHSTALAPAGQRLGRVSMRPRLGDAGDYRDVLIPILRRHTPDADVVRVFPGHEAKPLGQAGVGA